ncbi:MAG: winged helix-turn-helix domain-containing protein [Chitinophagales bacterium]
MKLNSGNYTEIMVDLERGDIWLKDENHHLTAGELRILRLLLRREGRPVKAETLAAQVPSDPADYGCGDPRHHIVSLRRKLRHTSEHPVIATRSGLGYYLVAKSIVATEINPVK